MLLKGTHSDVSNSRDLSGNYVMNMASSGCKQSRCVRVAVLGASGVGKTSLIEQFVFNSFSFTHKATRKKRVYSVTVFHAERYYQLQIVDLPPLARFPVASLHEYSTCGATLLHHCDAILLVYDVTRADTFQHIRRLRAQMMDFSPGSVPVVVAANKCDSSSDSKQTTRRDVTAYVRKQWRCAYCETSARSNWRVTALFKDVVRVIESGETSQKVTTTRAARVQNALRSNHCNIL